MTDEVFIQILKSHFKAYFESGQSVGMEVKEIVAEFRREIKNSKRKKKNESNPKN